MFLNLKWDTIKEYKQEMIRESHARKLKRQMMNQWLKLQFRDMFVRMTFLLFGKLKDLYAMQKKQKKASKYIALQWRLSR